MASSELWPQRFLGPTQKSPVEFVSQSTMPQAQLASLGAVPSVVAHVGNLLQRLLLDVSQINPVVCVQSRPADAGSTPPQTQGPALAVAPSVWLQGLARHTEKPDMVTVVSLCHVILSIVLTLCPVGPLPPA